MGKILIPTEIKGKDLFNYLVTNKSKIIAAKKSCVKYTDLLSTKTQITFPEKQSSVKADGTIVMSPVEGVVHVKVVGNSAWFCDSQKDVLTDTAYNKSVNGKGVLIPHIADHNHISTNHVGDVTAVYTQKMDIKDLGYDAPGKTTAFIMETDVREDYNSLTYKFYKNGKITNHSIGLIYESLGMCINDKDFLPEYEMWKKYYDKVINKEEVDDDGYFFIVPEIRVLENSCVMFGANEYTPTLEINSEENPVQPDKKSIEQEQRIAFDILKAITKTKFFN